MYTDAICWLTRRHLAYEQLCCNSLILFPKIDFLYVSLAGYTERNVNISFCLVTLVLAFIKGMYVEMNVLIVRKKVLNVSQ